MTEHIIEMEVNGIHPVKEHQIYPSSSGRNTEHAINTSTSSTSSSTSFNESTPTTPNVLKQQDKDAIFQRNILSLLNKRGYNVRDSGIYTSSTNDMEDYEPSYNLPRRHSTTSSKSDNLSEYDVEKSYKYTEQTFSFSKQPSTPNYPTRTPGTPNYLHRTRRSSGQDHSIHSQNGTNLSTRSSQLGSSSASVLLGLREPNHGQGPLHIAVRKADRPVIDALLSDANDCAEELVNLADHHGNTPLHFACGNSSDILRSQMIEIAKKLLDAGASVEARNKRGLTPIAVHVLTLRKDEPAMLKLLLEYESYADTEVHGATLLHRAATHELPIVAGILVSYGANLMALNADGFMAFEVASTRVKYAMLGQINKAPNLAPISLRSNCMKCQTKSLLSTGALFMDFFRKLLGFSIMEGRCNCYHCGLLYCQSCLKPAKPYIDALKPSFVRVRTTDLSKVKICGYCEVVLSRRLNRLQRRTTFENRLTGNTYAAFGA